MSTLSELNVPSTSKSVDSSDLFLISIQKNFDDMLHYENVKLLSLAKLHIPKILELKTMERMREAQKKIKHDQIDKDDISYEVAYLIELQNWFKTSFFSWVDCPECTFCCGPTEYSHNTSEIHCGTYIRVEVFKCTLCDTMTDFCRYNDLETLLTTRKGRCGEWAKCFTLLCRAMNYDARLVVDSTDHLWTEVYSFDLCKWLHCDPCENIIDMPLIYEAGWKKKITYIIAYSRDDIQDVTWKYSNNHKEVLTRRDKCTEDELIYKLLTLRNYRWRNMSKHRVKFLKKRLCKEIVEMMVRRHATDEEKVGRTSGSLAWCLERNEASFSPYLWELDDANDICVRYNTFFDKYEIVVNNEVVKTISEWLSGLYEMKNIFRKEESDWKMIYLARKEDSDQGVLSWKICTKGDTKIKKIKIKVSSTTFHNGTVLWTLNYNDKRHIIPKETETNFILDNIENITEFTLAATLSGKDKTDWQHAQIFRQKMGSNDYPMEITVSCVNCDSK